MKRNKQESEMGYNTEYRGTIHIDNLDLNRVRNLKKYLGKNMRDFLPFNHLTQPPFTQFDVHLNDDMTGLVWNVKSTW